MKLKLVTILLSGLLMSSCEKEFILDLPGAENIIVVNSFFNSDEELSLTVTKSMLPQQNQTVVELENSKVSLFTNGAFVEDLIYYKAPDDVIGSFYSNTKPVPGQTYKVEVETNDMGKAISQSVLPQKVDIVSDTAIWLKWISNEDSSFTIRYYFEIEFNDPQGENYYFITASVPVYKEDTINNTRQFEAWQYAEILSGDLPLHEIYLNNALLFKDVTFNATLKMITGTATMYSNPDPHFYDEDEPFVLDKSKLHIELHSLSKDAYNFCSSFAKKIAAQDDVYSEPTVIYTNIENGLGIFAGENISKRDIVIQY
jgi:hypothetical protein